jgi:4-nitrophenyl phosphatase
MILKEKFPKIKGLIFDMDGVLWKENVPLIDLKSFFDALTRNGYRFVLATNNATKSSKQFQDKLLGFNVQITERNIITSSLATAHYLKKRFPEGGPVYIVGEDGLVDTLAKEGFYPAENNVLAVVAGLDRHLSYEKLKRATILIRNGALFIGTNPDRTFPTPDGLIPGGGAVVAAIEAASGTIPIYIGKPYSTMMDMAFEVMETTPETTMMIGDRLDTDILAGQKANCKTTLVLSGVTTIEEIENWFPKPDLVLSSADKLIE